MEEPFAKETLGLLASAAANFATALLERVAPIIPANARLQRPLRDLSFAAHPPLPIEL